MTAVPYHIGSDAPTRIQRVYKGDQILWNPPISESDGVFGDATVWLADDPTVLVGNGIPLVPGSCIRWDAGRELWAITNVPHNITLTPNSDTPTSILDIDAPVFIEDFSLDIAFGSLSEKIEVVAFQSLEIVLTSRGAARAVIGILFFNGADPTPYKNVVVELNPTSGADQNDIARAVVGVVGSHVAFRYFGPEALTPPQVTLWASAKPVYQDQVSGTETSATDQEVGDGILVRNGGIAVPVAGNSAAQKLTLYRGMAYLNLAIAGGAGTYTGRVQFGDATTRTSLWDFQVAANGAQTFPLPIPSRPGFIQVLSNGTAAVARYSVVTADARP